VLPTQYSFASWQKQASVQFYFNLDFGSCYYDVSRRRIHFASSCISQVQFGAEMQLTFAPPGSRLLGIIAVREESSRLSFPELYSIRGSPTDPSYLHAPFCAHSQPFFDAASRLTPVYNVNLNGFFRLLCFTFPCQERSEAPGTAPHLMPLASCR